MQKKEESAKKGFAARFSKKISRKNKKALLLCALFLAVLAAGYANFALKTGDNAAITPTQAQSDGETVDVFATYRDQRSTSRAEQLTYIESVVTSAETDEATKSEAQKQKLALVASMETELNTEGLIQTKLNTDAVVSIADDAVSVVVRKQTLTDDEVTQIVEIVKTQTGKPAQNIKIMPQSGE